MNKFFRTLSRGIIYLVLLFVAFITIFPVFSIIAASFKSNMEILIMPERILPESWSLENYVLAFHSENFRVGRMLFNSTWFSLASVMIILFTSSVCGYVFARGEFRGKKLIFTVFSSLMFISMGSITIYPQLRVLSVVGLNKSLYGLLVMQCFGIPVVNMYLVRGFVNALPKELDEAATIDGCTFTGILFRVIFPLLLPVLATIGVLTFNSSWNNYIMPSIFTMTKPEQQTLIVGIMALKNSGESATSWNILFAATTMAIIPVLVIFIFGNKFITQGIAAGAVKG